MADFLRLRREEHGFTLVELLVVVLLVGVVGAIFASSMVSALGVDRRTKSRAEVTQELTIANERMSREIRAASPLVSVGPTSITVETYVVGQRRRHTFTYDSGTRTVTQTTAHYASATATSPTSTGTKVIGRSIAVPAGVPVFVALERDGSPTTTAKDVASVSIKLVGDPRETSPVEVETTIFLRNYQG